MLARHLEHPFGARRDERVAVDLAVRMGQRDADLLAAVLEAVHLLHPGPLGQLRGAVRPGVVEVEDLATVRELVLGTPHAVVPSKLSIVDTSGCRGMLGETSAMISSPTCSASCAAAAGASPSSVISTSASSRSAMVEMPT